MNQTDNKAMKRSFNPTRLRKGHIVEYDGEDCLVWSVNECRANISPLRSINIVVNGNGQWTEKSGKSIGISPNSEIPILRKIEGNIPEEAAKLKTQIKDSRMSETNQPQQEKQMKKTKKKKQESASTEKKTRGRVSKYGTINGYSALSVIRAMGSAGWTLDEVKEYVLNIAKIDMKPTTIRSQWWWAQKRGAKGADITKKELEEMRPKGMRDAAKKKGKKDKDETPTGTKKKKKKREEPVEEQLETPEEEAPVKKKKKKKKTPKEEPSSEEPEPSEEESPKKKKKKKKKLPVYEEEQEELDYDSEDDGL